MLSFRHITGFKHSKNSVKTTYIALNNNVVQSFMFIKGKQFHDILTNRYRPNIKRMAYQHRNEILNFGLCFADFELRIIYMNTIMILPFLLHYFFFTVAGTFVCCIRTLSEKLLIQILMAKYSKGYWLVV